MNNQFLIKQKFIEFITLNSIEHMDEFIDRLPELYEYLEGYDLMPSDYNLDKFIEDSREGWVKNITGIRSRR